MKKKTANRLEWVFLITFLISFIVLLSSCKTKTVYVPQETIRTEYKDRLQRDSIHLLDSVFVDRWKSGDTIYQVKEKYKYLFRDKIVRDTISKTDSIAVPYPVVETKEVNKLHSWQIILMCLGGVLIGYLGYRLIRLFK